MIKLNDKADILLRYFVGSQSIRKIAKETKFSRNTVRKYIRNHEEKLQDLDKAKSRDEILTLIESLVETPKYDCSTRNKYKMNEKIQKNIDNWIKKIKSDGQKACEKCKIKK